MKSNKAKVDPSWADYYSMCICVDDFVPPQGCMSGPFTGCVCLQTHSDRMHFVTLQDAGRWLAGWQLIHSGGTNLSRQLDSLTDFTADIPAGSVSCNNPGMGVILFGSCQHETQCFPTLHSSAEPKELVIIIGSKRGQRVERAK